MGDANIAPVLTNHHCFGGQLKHILDMYGMSIAVHIIVPAHP